VADETSVPPQGRRSRPLNVSVSNATVESATFSRVNMRTGDPSSAETDILNEVAESVDDQTSSLRSAIERGNHRVIKALDNLSKSIGKGEGIARNDIEQITKAIEASAISAGAGGGGGDGGGQGANFADIKASERRAEILNKVFDDVKDAVKGPLDSLDNLTPLLEIVNQSIKNQLVQNINNTTRALADFSESIFDIKGQFSNLKNEAKSFWQEFGDASKTGLISFNEALTDDWLEGLREGKQTMLDTFKSIRRASEEGYISPLGTLGNNLSEVASSIQELRDSAEAAGFDALGAMDFREMSDSTIALFDLEKRRDSLANIKDAETRRSIVTQMEHLKNISAFTGQTVGELVKQRAQTSKDFANLVGVTLTEEQAKRLTEVSDSMEALGLKEMKSFLLEIAQAGGNMEVAIGQNEDLRNFVIRTQGGRELLQRAFTMQTEGRSGADIMSELSELAGQVQTTGPSVAMGQQFVGSRFGPAMGELRAAAGRTREELEDIMDRQSDAVGGFVRGIEDFLAKFPFTGLVSAIALNTIAVIANTVALGMQMRGLRSALGGGRGRGGRGGRGAAGGAGGRVQRGAGMDRLNRMKAAGLRPGAGGAAAGRGGLRAAAGIAGKVGARAIPGLGTLLSGGAAIGSLMEGDVIGVLGHSTAALASLIPGLGTAAALAIEGGLAARQVFGSQGEGDRVGPDPAMNVNKSKDSSIADSRPQDQTQELYLELMRQQVHFLGTLVGETQQIKSIQSDIRDNIGNFGAASPEITRRNSGINRRNTPAAPVALPVSAG